MSSRRMAVLAGFGVLLGLAQAQAEPMVDPMRPPNPGTGPQASRPALVLQSVIISETRRIAVINGQVLREGERLRAYRVAAIAPGRVELDKGGERKVLEFASGIRLSQEPREQ